ncbi:hypothetical protein LK07_23015 [Streptomyces pluripotens]|uniref:Peptidoglycan binding domain-containing protein n=1 Tax=Streptomyces pluripotens TaxID=1355015 RepID=A0A221P2M6_9ACTN|nr:MULTISPECIES: membrane protein [Streptomyces]ARP72157.1 hypothetical protein LK06_021860 [Streptomyces pluripotens]ASN26404.1 hypothetical protein LK07_23015 [Streptomyces pluripotens]KIE22959.1 membrane protein [Streptomyces sp. MUSC 125]MCH0556016.1 hypothetical protein [Streptomyces sp. MUM 16J]
MSRETDTPSSGPDGRGGAAYPSGTPPYGTPMASDDGTDAARSGTQPEERKTETTLTTRIRINIPGSRPIPPVVVRKPVGDGEGVEGDASAADSRPTPAQAASRSAEAPAEPSAPVAAPADEKTSDWFAPRKSSAAKGGPGGGGPNGAGIAGGSSASSGTPEARSGGPAAPGTAGTTGGRPGAARPGRVVGSMSAPGTTRPGGTKGKGLPGATGGPVAPGHGGGTGSFDVTEALAAGPRSSSSHPGTSSGGEPHRDGLPYFSENGGQDGFAGRGEPVAGTSGYDGFGGGTGMAGAGGHNGFGHAAGAHGPGGPAGPGDPDGSGGQGGLGITGSPAGPVGPTSGPVTGDGTLTPPAGHLGMEPGEPFDGPAGATFGGPRGVGVPGAPASAGTAPGGPAGRVGGGGISDDTAVLTPQTSSLGGPGTPGHQSPAADNVSGHTVTSGIPVIPNTGNSPFGPGSHSGGPASSTDRKPEPSATAPKAGAKTGAKPKKKGRSKLVLLGAAVFVVAGGAYGAGLLMNHTDVPKGTTVLGVDIGGGTRDDALKKLDEAFGSRVHQPLKLSVDGKTVSITPGNAGLQFDYQATVSAAAKSDYNPVHVIGSLFGQKRAVEPVMPVDEEKLQAALQQAGGGSGSVTEGTIEFKPGRAVAVYGKAGKSIDPGRSARVVEQAYRTQVETGTATPVTVPTATQQPTVSKAEVDREMKEFAGPAMSANVIVQTDAAHSIPMSPQKSLWKFLRVKRVSGGKLTDAPDLAALQQLYGQTFDGVLITRANGKKTAVTPQDVYLALRRALTSTTNRVAVIDTNPG